MVTTARKLRIVAVVLLVSSGCLLTFFKFFTTSPQNFNILEKPTFTDFDELKERRKNGFLDNTPLKDLLESTKFLQKLRKSPCSSDTVMVILVQSACSHEAHREAIRETWGRKAVSMGIPVVFFVGQCPDSKQEREEYKDIVEVNFVDSYYNNTIKSLARYRWFLGECSSSTYLLMADDDTVFIIDHLLSFLEKGIGYSIVGPLYEAGTPVFRNKDSKWYVPDWVWPFSTYPKYLGGWSYVVNGSAVEVLYKASLESKFMTIDDVLFTGIIADFVGLYKLGDPRFPLTRSELIDCTERSIFVTQDLSPSDIQDYWKRRIRKCETLT